MADAKSQRRARIEHRRAEAAAKRSARKARYGTQTNLADGNERCCCVRAATVRMVVNGLFFVLGILILALGISAATGDIAGIFGAFPGVSVIVMSALVIGVAVLGEYGARTDNKCILLIYMLVIFAGFVAFVVLGSATAFGGETAGAQAERAWCAFPESAARGQERFNCCGLGCPSDRPAMGSCPGGAAPNVSSPLDPSCAAGHDSAALCALRPPAVNSTLPGCKGLAETYVRERLGPLFVASFFVGLLLLAGLMVACSLLCRRTRPGAGTRKERGMQGAAEINDAQEAETGWLGDGDFAEAGAAPSSAGPATAAYDETTALSPTAPGGDKA